MSTKTKGEWNQNISLKCAICLQLLPNFARNEGGQKQKYFYKICCETLKIHNFLQLNSKSSVPRNDHTIRFCYNCMLTLKELNKLINKLASIQNSIKKFEIDIKSKIMRSYKQETPRSRKLRGEVTDIYTADRQYFRHMAIKDLLPIVRVPKVDGSQNISSECKTSIKHPDPNWIQRIVYTETIVTKTDAGDEDKIDIVKHEAFDNYIVVNDTPFPENCDEFILSVSSNEDPLGMDSSPLATVFNEIPLSDSGLQTNNQLTNTHDTLIVSGKTDSIQLEEAEQESDVEHDGNDDLQNSDYECDNNQDVDSDYEPKSGKRSAKSTEIKWSSSSKKRKIQNSPRPDTIGCEEIVQLEEGEKEKYSDVEHDGNDDMQNSDYECSNNHDVDSDYEPESSKRSIQPTGRFSPIYKRNKLKNESISDKKGSSKKVPKEKRKREKKPKRNQLQGVEIKIAEGKWRYREIEYTYDESTSLYTCSVCAITRKTQVKLRNHIGSHHGVEGYGKWHYAGVPYSLIKDSGRFECSVCKKDFLDRGSVSRHIREFHRDKCQKEKMQKKIYYEDKIKAQKGGVKFQSKLLIVPPVVLEEGKWLYREVEITKLAEDGKFSCGACARVRKGWHSILLHVIECHDEKAKLENECQVCGMQFSTSYRLKGHMQKHTEGKSHQCEQCGEFFQQKSSMTAHKARVHEMRRPHVCEYCAKSFFTRKDLRVHLRTHTKEKPYVCEFPGCGMTFAILQTMKNHMNSKVHQS